MRQLQTEGATSQIIHDTVTRLSEMQARGSQARETARDEMARRRENANLGIVDVTDQQTGRHLTVESGSNYYWVDPNGRIVGTEVDTAPAVDFRKLLQLP